MQHGKGMERDNCSGRSDWLDLLARLKCIQVKPKHYKVYVTPLRAH